MKAYALSNVNRHDGQGAASLSSARSSVKKPTRCPQTGGTPPAPDIYKINMDGSFVLGQEHAGWGGGTVSPVFVVLDFCGFMVPHPIIPWGCGSTIPSFHGFMVLPSHNSMGL